MGDGDPRQLVLLREIPVSSPAPGEDEEENPGLSRGVAMFSERILCEVP